MRESPVVSPSQSVAGRDIPVSRAAARWAVPAARRALPRGGAPTHAVAAATVLALVLRGAIATRGGIWLDEALFLSVVDEPTWGAMFAFLRDHESHPPLFYALMRGWLGLIGRGDLVALALPCLLGAALVPVMYGVATRLFSTRVGLIAALLVATTPALAEHSALMRPYSLLPLLSLVSSYALVRAIGTGSRRAWGTWVASSLGLLYTHNWAVLVVAAQWLALAVALSRAAARPRRRVLGEFAVAQAAVGVGFGGWVPTLLFQAAHAGHVPVPLGSVALVADFGAFVSSTVMTTTLIPAPSGPGAASMRLASLAFLLALSVAGGVYILRRPDASRRARSASRRPDERSALIVLVLVPLLAVAAAAVLSVRSNMILARCVVIVAPSLLLAFTWAVDRLLAAPGTRLPASIAMVALCLANAGGLYALLRTTRSNAREFAAQVAARTEPGDVVIVAPGYVAPSFNHYYALPVERIDYPRLGREMPTRYDDLRDRVADPEAFARVRRRLTDARREGRRVWLVGWEVPAVGSIGAEAAAAMERSASYQSVGMLRAYQLRAQLLHLYGPPLFAVQERQDARYERFVGLLFAPPRAPPGNAREPTPENVRLLDRIDSLARAQ